jgi:hypothetical protein
MESARKLPRACNRKKLLNQEIELDGKRFENCTFTNVTLIYRGKAPYIFANNNINKPMVVKIVVGPQESGSEFARGFILSACRDHFESCDVRGIFSFVSVDEKMNVQTQ